MVMTMVVVFSFAYEAPHNHQLIEHQCNFCSLSGNFDGLDSTYDVDSNVVNAEDDSLLRGFWGVGGWMVVEPAGEEAAKSGSGSCHQQQGPPAPSCCP